LYGSPHDESVIELQVKHFIASPSQEQAATKQAKTRIKILFILIFDFCFVVSWQYLEERIINKNFVLFSKYCFKKKEEVLIKIFS
jgi:hypothetical protein